MTDDEKKTPHQKNNILQFSDELKRREQEKMNVEEAQDTYDEIVEGFAYDLTVKLKEQIAEYARHYGPRVTPEDLLAIVLDAGEQSRNEFMTVGDIRNAIEEG